MVNITFESHATTYDNEIHLASGRYDVALSPLGERGARELGNRYRDEIFDCIFCSDLQRSYKTAEIAFLGRGFPIVTDDRLSECDYGDLTRHTHEEIDIEKPKRIDVPFPNGESYSQCMEKMRSFLQDLLRDYDNKEVMIIGHRATQYGLEHLINNLPLEEVLTATWKWQPGWKYQLIKI